MSLRDVQPLKAEGLSAEELRLQKAQQAIDELLVAANQDETLKRQLETVTSSESLVEIAARQGYQLKVADLEALLYQNQEQAQHHSDEFDDDELSEQELEVVVGGSITNRTISIKNCSALGHVYGGNYIPSDFRNMGNLITKLGRSESTHI